MDSKTFGNAVATFSAKFCKELKTDKSVVSSPLSAEFVLALVALGAEDPAHREILAALGIKNDDVIRKSFREASNKLQGLEGVTLNIANKVYVKEANCNLNQTLQKDAVEVFDAAIEKINFKDAMKASRTINGWVESKTNNRIKDLVSADSLDSETRLVLVNALYFKGNWKSKFDAKLTSDQTFHVNSSATIEVPMMYKEAEFQYGENKDLDSKILILPYKGNGASMAIILPNEIEGLDAVLHKLAGGFDLMTALQKTVNVKVEVTIPKFKIETEIDLMEVLPKLGITSIFNAQNSGLNKILENPEPLVVSKAIQKAFIEVNEEGSEAAAATAVVRTRRSLVEHRRTVFRVDRPALWCIIAEEQLLFLARFQPSVPPPTQRDEL